MSFGPQKYLPCLFTAVMIIKATDEITHFLLANYMMKIMINV